MSSQKMSTNRSVSAYLILHNKAVARERRQLRARPSRLPRAILRRRRHQGVQFRGRRVQVGARTATATAAVLLLHLGGRVHDDQPVAELHREVGGALLASALRQIGEHRNLLAAGGVGAAHVLLHHQPELVDGVGQRALRGDVAVLRVVGTLCKHGAKG